MHALIDALSTTHVMALSIAFRVDQIKRKKSFTKSFITF